ncbi:hypothetical protein BY996DRAFT_1162529 [Phakopsora pachyrhizi]|uniref:Nuclear cap-binding protein subunit 2 n=1 Tax=Phakopsora pachyrhizi TaxID=170000 RepID=A0AAV0ASY7_PHAPC|nr:hypothetical protein BY996DRAFT_1162529 [Phakopsora pachyrhizi]CAH7672659.1 hypothetical protein PPACK8108_LOCUS7476 [Phakopsora pachyrhizi]
MAHVCQNLDSYSSYRDSRSNLSYVDQQIQLSKSSTVYVGNLSFFTTEEQIFELFSRVSLIKRIIMGLDRNSKTPCGFCFVEYYRPEDALACLRYISGTKLDERIIRADLDPGYLDGRQYGRGKSGGQVRDEYREDYDVGRGGWGHLKQRQEEKQRQLKQDAMYRDDHDNGGNREVPDGASKGGPRFREDQADEDAD